jgi:putative hydrolase of the HAD superfamily
MPLLRALFFDIGDTLVFDDPPLRERFGAALREMGVAYSPRRLPEAFRAGENLALTHYLQGLPWDDPAVMRGSAACVLEALGLLPLLSEAHWKTLLQHFLAVPFVRHVHPGAIPLLAELQGRGFRIGAISDWDTELPDLLAQWGLTPYLDAVAISCHVGITKPGHALFLNALSQVDVDPSEAMHIGDWYTLDVAGAHGVGMQALLFDHAGRTPDADCPRVTTFPEMEQYLLALPSPQV